MLLPPATSFELKLKINNCTNVPKWNVRKLYSNVITYIKSDIIFEERSICMRLQAAAFC